jgi:hypothetical protein
MPNLGSISGGTTANQKDGTHSGRGRGRGRATSHMNSSTGRGSSRGRVRGSGHPARSAASPFSSNEDAGQTGKQPLGGTPSFTQGQQSNGFGFAGIMNGTSQFGKPSTASGSANSFHGFKTPSITPRAKNNSVDHSRDPRRQDAFQPSVPLKHTIEAAPVEDVKTMGGYQDRYEKVCDSEKVADPDTTSLD